MWPSKLRCFVEPTGRPVGVYLCRFCQRDAVFIAVFVIARCVCVSVRPSLSLSQSGVTSKRLNVSAHDGPQHFCKLIAVTKCRLDGSRLKYEVHGGATESSYSPRSITDREDVPLPPPPLIKLRQIDRKVGPVTNCSLPVCI